jgi:hypothetical protein
MANHGRPAVVLICHRRDRLDSIGLASWIASTMHLAGMVVIDGDGARKWRVARREIARHGWLRFLDAAAFRAYDKVRHARATAAWAERELERLRARYPAALEHVPSVTVRDPNHEQARAFIARTAPDFIIARCKFILSPAVFGLPRFGSYALHPGICPEYRNAHGCFWALTRRDLDRVGMTLLRIDRGVDTGPVLLHATCQFDELRESHHVIQGRVVFDNLDRIGEILAAVARGEGPPPIDVSHRGSAVWGQPRFTSYVRWKLAARRDRRRLERQPAVS